MAVKTEERREREGQLVQFHSRISGASAKPLAQITAFPVECVKFHLSKRMQVVNVLFL